MWIFFVKRHFVIQVLIYQYNMVHYTKDLTNERLESMYKKELHLFGIIVMVQSKFLFIVVSIGLGQSFQF